MIKIYGKVSLVKLMENMDIAFNSKNIMNVWNGEMVHAILIKKIYLVIKMFVVVFFSAIINLTTFCLPDPITEFSFYSWKFLMYQIAFLYIIKIRDLYQYGYGVL